MYIDSIRISNFRVFKNTEIDFIHPDQNYLKIKIPQPKLPNINLLLGNNGSGKSTLLKAIALAALGPSVRDSGIFPYHLIRESAKSGKVTHPHKSVIQAKFTAHPQDRTPSLQWIESWVEIHKRGDRELLSWAHPDEKLWYPIFSEDNEAFFIVGYGATRRSEKRENVDLGSRQASASIRAQRVKGLFEESYSLIPLNIWLPKYKKDKPKQYKEVVFLINRLIEKTEFDFDGSMEDGEYTLTQNGLKIPFPAISDGYQAFLGWVGDLLYYVCKTCPPGKRLIANKGIVMVDEIDLHLHPKWQMTILPTIAKTLPNIQFIVTSHSPLIVGSLEWMNIIVMRTGPDNTRSTERIPYAVYGLDADQVLLTDFFGLDSTRAPGKQRQLKQLALDARKGKKGAAAKLLRQISQGMEEEG